MYGFFRHLLVAFYYFTAFIPRQEVVVMWRKDRKLSKMAEELKDTFREGWQGFWLPIIILLPFILDYFFKFTVFTARLGKDGAKYMSLFLLIFIGGLVSISAVIIKERYGCANLHMDL